MDAVNSVLHQKTSYSYELHIYDHSTDEKTIDLLKKISSPKIKVHFIGWQPHVLQYFKNFNVFVDSVEAKYICNMQDDDLLREDFVEKMCKGLEEHEAVYCGMEFVRKNKTIEHYFLGKVLPDKEYQAAGNLEPFMVGVRKSMLLRLKYPYWKAPSPSLADVVKSIHDWLNRISLHTKIYPTEKDLYIHRTLEGSTYSTY